MEDSLRATVGLTILKEIQWINIILADIRDGHVRDGRAGDRRFKAPTAFVIRTQHRYMVYDPMQVMQFMTLCRLSAKVHVFSLLILCGILTDKSPSIPESSLINSSGFSSRHCVCCRVTYLGHTSSSETTGLTYSVLIYIANAKLSYDVPPLFPPSSVFKQCTMCRRLGLELPACPTPGH